MKKNMNHSQQGALVVAALALATLFPAGCTMPGVYRTGQRNADAQAQAQPQPQPQAQTEIPQAASPRVSVTRQIEDMAPLPAPAATPEPEQIPPVFAPADASASASASASADASASASAVVDDANPAPPALAAPPDQSEQPAAPVAPESAAPEPTASAPAPAAPASSSASASTSASSDTSGQPLVDTVWQLATLDNIPVHAPAPATIMMLDTKRKGLLGRSGDMIFKAQFEIDAASLRFTQIASNRPKASVTAFEAAILDALAHTTGWRITEHTLTLFNQDGVLATLTVAGK